MYSYLVEEDNYFTVALLQSQPLKLLKALSSHEEGLTQPTKGVIAFLELHKDHPWTISAQSNAIAATAIVRSGDRWGVAHIEEDVWPKNAQVSYSATEIVVTKSNGDEAVVTNNPIPLMPGSESRVGIQYVAVAITSMIDLEKGQLVQIKGASDWALRFPDNNYPVNPAGIVKVKKIFTKFYDPSFKAAHMQEALTLKGASWVQFLMPFLVNLPLKDYWELATVVTSEFFNVVRLRVKDKKWIRTKYTDSKGDQQYFIPIQNLTVPSAKDCLEMDWPAKLPSPIVVSGPIKTLQFSPSYVNASFKTAVNVLTTSMGFRGGTSRGLGFLCTGLGYAGLPSVNTKRLAMQLSLIVPLLQNYKVTLKVGVADVVPIHLAISRWSELFKISITHLFFQVPLEDLSKVHKDCKPRCVTSIQDDTVFVWVSAEQMPTVKADDETGLIYERSAKAFLASVPAVNYVIVCPVYHPIFFASKDRFVFGLGSAWDFRCLISDKTDVKRAGIEGDAPFYEDLDRIMTGDDLWPLVVRDNGRMVGFLLAPKTSYHPSMNLLQRPAVSGALTMNSDGVWEYSATDINENNPDFEYNEDDSDQGDDEAPIEPDDEEEHVSIVPPAAPLAQSSATITRVGVSKSASEHQLVKSVKKQPVKEKLVSAPAQPSAQEISDDQEEGVGGDEPANGMQDFGDDS
jgi:hypothetical protein